MFFPFLALTVLVYHPTLQISLLKSDPSTLLSRGLVSDTGTPDTYCVVAAADTGERRCPQNEPPLNSRVLQEVACPNVTPNYGPSLGSGNIQARSLSVGGHPGSCGGFPLDARSTRSRDNHGCPQILPRVSCGGRITLGETHRLPLTAPVIYLYFVNVRTRQAAPVCC